MSPEVTLLAAVALPFVALPAVLALHRRPNLREAATLVTALCLVLLVLSLANQVQQGARPAARVVETLPGLAIAFEAEPLGVLFALLASFLWLVTSVYSIGYMRGHGEAHQTRFYACFAAALGSTMGVALAGNLFTLFIFYELLTLTTYPLVTHSGDAAARRAGRVYLGLLLGSSVAFFLLALVATWSLTGTLAFRHGGILAGVVSPGTAAILLALYLFIIARMIGGLGVGAALEVGLQPGAHQSH